MISSNRPPPSGAFSCPSTTIVGRETFIPVVVLSGIRFQWAQTRSSRLFCCWTSRPISCSDGDEPWSPPPSPPPAFCGGGGASPGTISNSLITTAISDHLPGFALLCATSVLSGSLWLMNCEQKHNTETQRTQRLHREIQNRDFVQSTPPIRS